MKKKVLVVGTTPDYVDWIRKSCPGRAVFLTAPEIRNMASQENPGPDEEFLCPVEDKKTAMTCLSGFLDKWKYRLSGIACFDCQAMELSSGIASEYGLSYPKLYAIRNCRDKLVCKEIWTENKIPCPRAEPMNSTEDVLRFFILSPKGIVLKPICGSGSELVFRCKSVKECETAFAEIREGLKKRSADLLFTPPSLQENLLVAEEFLPGPEYSCDFILENNTVTIIRMTRKIKADGLAFGTCAGYVLVSEIPGVMDPDEFRDLLRRAAKSLDIHRGLCMVDFMIREKQPVLIEMTPRPGGDCLPFLLREAGGLDILKLTLDFAENRPLTFTGMTGFKPYIGMRLFARKSGILTGFRTELLEGEKRIKSIHFTKNPGHVITLPPQDYDSWNLGHLILAPDAGSFPESQCSLIVKRLGIDIEKKDQ